MKNARFGKKTAVGLAILSGVLFLGANAHFIYLAATTQPDCVVHKKSGGYPDKGFAAAKSSC
ncbi:MAG: hypothetical protein ACAH80_03545 [Alphaproteobacteria bacterium]